LAWLGREGDLVNRTDILLSVQRALLGAIGSEILAICIDVRREEVEIVAFAEQILSLTQREALQIVGTEVMADLASPVPVTVRVVEQAKQPLKCQGTWVFLRLHCLVE